MALQKVADTSSFRTSELDTRDSARSPTAPGFRHFLGSPAASQRFRAFGVDPLTSPAVLPDLRRLMQRLSRRMDAAIHWPPHGHRSAERWENPLIPSGYTYLLQFVAHDLVHSAIPLSVAGGLGGGTANARRVPLRLETLYGSGPVGSPHIYALDAPNDDRRTKLRLGRMRWKENQPATGCPFRDIARTQAENVTGIDRSIAGVRVALTEALVADPRNDDHAVMSQLTALLALLHNGLVDIIRRRENNAGPNGQFGAAYKRFLCARGALTAIYHNIIRNDLMRRVIHPAVHASYSAPAPHFLDRPAPAEGLAIADWEIPFEFSHGAFRFGHAMVRPEYQINDLSLHDLNNTLEKSSVNDPANMPLDETWMVQWSRFFEINGSTPNFSRRIGPHLSDGLGNDQIFPAFDETERVGLLYRDLLGAGLAGMWSVDALIAEIGNRRPQFMCMSRLLTDRTYRVNQLREWLVSGQAYGTFTNEDIETLSNDPPLPFFILFEAMQQTEGLQLGLLGSIIVSETIFGTLASDPQSAGGGSLADQLELISREFYLENVLQEIPEISSMAQLVEFTTEIAGLQQATPAFL
jgi:heme peroxidase